MTTKHDFWTCIHIAATKLAVNPTTFRTWKMRKQVPYRMVIPVFKALEGTEHALTLEQLSNPAPS